MVHIFLIFFVLLNCITPIYGSEVDKKLIIFTVKVALASDSLKYCDKKYIELIKKEYGVICNDNDPFIAVPEYKSIDARTQSIEERKNALDAFVNNVDCAFYNQQCAFLEQDLEYLGVYGSFKRLKEVTFLPFNLFYVRDDNRLTFKKEDSVLFSFKKHIESIEYEFEIRLKTDFDGGNPQDCLNRFKKLPLCMIGGFNGGNQKPGFIDTKPLEDELLNAGILAKDGENIVHGPHGYSSEDISKIILLPHVENFRLIYSGAKNRLICKSFGMESEENEIFCSALRGSEHKNECDIQNIDNCDSIAKKDLDAILSLFKFNAIPYRFLLQDNQIKKEGNRFKQEGDEISSLIITINNSQYAVILKMPYGISGEYDWLDGVLSNFKDEPGYFIDDEEELIKKGILVKKDNKIVHGPHWYNDDIPKIVLHPAVQRITSACLLYSGKVNMQNCAAIGIESEQTEPFCTTFCGVSCLYDKDEIIENIKKTNSLTGESYDKAIHYILDTFAKIEAIPYRSLIDGNNFKSGEAEISSSIVTVFNSQWRVIVKMPNCTQEEVEINNLFSKFENKANYHHEDEEELLKAGIIEKKDGKIFHGPKGYFEYKLPAQPIIKESPSSFFSLKNLLFCCAGFTGLVIISVIYLRSINPC